MTTVPAIVAVTPADSVTTDALPTTMKKTKKRGRKQENVAARRCRWEAQGAT